MKISAIITTHNRSDVLPRAVKSVLAQTYKDIELIVVSDGSTDDTDVYLNNLKKYNDVTIITYHPGRGANYARNQGILHAKGEYIAFLDDDDEWLPSKIEKQVSVVREDPNIGLVYTGKNIIYVNEGISYSNIPTTVSEHKKQILFHNFIGSTSCVMASTEIVKRAGMFDEELMALQDYDLWIRICQNTEIGYVSEPLLNYYNESGSNQISDNSLKYETAYKYIEEKYLDLYSHLTNDELIDIKKMRRSALAKRCMRNSNKKSARKYLIDSWKLKPDFKTISLGILSYIPFNLVLRIRNIF